MRLLHDVLDTTAVVADSRPAVTGGSLRYTYGELRARSLALAGWLRRTGVTRGERVLVQAANHPDAAALLFATSRIGAVFVHVHPEVRAYQLGHILADCEPALVVTDGPRRPTAAALARGPVVDLAEIPAGGEDSGAWRPPLSVDPACLIYTSGSTAMPKAVVCPHAQMLFAARAIQQRLGYTAQDRIFCALPLSFDYGLYQLLLAGLAGAEVVLADPRTTGPALLTSLVRDEVTVLPAVPSLAANLARLLDRGGARPTRLRKLTNTGAAMPPAVLATLRAHLPDLRVNLMFGLTECKRVSVLEADGDLSRPGSVGPPLADTEAYVVDQCGDRLPPGQRGELVVRGGHVMAGYWRAPRLTGERFPVDERGVRYLRTGDVCWSDEDGYLYFAGRHDDVYKSKGLRVSAMEVEAAAMDVPGVDVAALLTPVDGVPACLVVTGRLSAPEVRKELTTRLEPHKIPDRCEVADAMPLTVNGKVDKRALRQTYGSGGRR